MPPPPPSGLSEVQTDELEDELDDESDVELLDVELFDDALELGSEEIEECVLLEEPLEWDD